MAREPAQRELKQERAARTRMDILEAAIHLFARRGFLATTMADLSRAIRMTPGALYWHFPTKEDLLLAAIEELHQRCVREFQLLGGYRELPAQAQFQAISERAHLLLREHREYGIFFAMLAAEAADSNDQVAEAIRDKLAIYATTLEDIIRHGQKTGEFRQDVDARHTAHSLIGGFLGVLVHQNLFRASMDFDLPAAMFGRLVTTGVMNLRTSLI
ncbi:TetR/AcrR family transcriptional regulator [Myxococcus xanthus]|uniref:TetR family transcriptional regulator n=1 Tax=Myxococcus xanthus TaxID=34 RepID=A0AAE6FW56_MYXXA|nr:TetR/AcrR family transcriptional regulator [Myxococcus xanthus]QDE66333.1 TetR family transcriptional regulator [Myxococcus xanthus]QDE73606.1 TetR family transcriptional regulator [Myxococcus xanthus]QDE95202.1 TetR family transcriptional regulator [Myxococcus xanthus]